VWKISAATQRFAEIRRADGSTMNSWMSTLLSACAPPLMMFIIGTGMTFGRNPPSNRYRPSPARAGGCVRRGQRNGQRRVRAEARLRVGAVELDQSTVQPGLVARVAPEQRRADFTVRVGDGLQHALAEVALLVAVTQFHRLARAGRGARRHAARPMTPPSRCTSASTVGLRENQRSRAP